MSTHDFDSIDLDWEYPEADHRNGKPEDFKNKFMGRLKNEVIALYILVAHLVGISYRLPFKAN